MYDDFGQWFLSEVHSKFQRFVASCALRDPSKINFDAVDFTNLIQRCVEKDCTVVTPPWLRVLRNKNKRGRGADLGQVQGKGGGGRGGRGNDNLKRGQNVDGNKNPNTMIQCQLTDKSLKLKEGEEFSKPVCQAVEAG